jgi:hypothetical protein
MTGIILFLISTLIYVLPTIIAQKTNHPSRTAITVLNILLGWTFLGWVGSLVWACLKPKP